jgi:hypothetical protein
VQDRGADDGEFLGGIEERFTTASHVEGLAHPFGNGHAASACDALDVAVFGIGQGKSRPGSNVVAVRKLADSWVWGKRLQAIHTRRIRETGGTFAASARTWPMRWTRLTCRISSSRGAVPKKPYRGFCRSRLAVCSKNLNRRRGEPPTPQFFGQKKRPVKARLPDLSRG